MKRTTQLPLLENHPHCYGKAWNPEDLCGGYNARDPARPLPPCLLYVECAEETKTLRHYHRDR